MEKTVYFDHAAATVPDAEVLALFEKESLRCYANAEAVHLLAYQARENLKRAAKRLSQALFGSEEYPVICDGTFPGACLFSGIFLLQCVKTGASGTACQSEKLHRP